MIDIVDKHDCCGCTACSSICKHNAIKMKPDSEGFFYPSTEKSLCIDCGLCERICPIIARDKSTEQNTPFKILALHNKDEETWTNSSSGGVFNSLSAYFIKHKGKIYGAEFNEDFIVVHRGETTPEGVLKFRGSKYVQSDLRGIFQEIKTYLNEGHKILFSGVPCQVEGLKNFLIKDYSNLTTVDILCHGVPSPKIFADYIKYIKKNSIFPLNHIFMKDKTFGWGYQNLRFEMKGKISEFNSDLSNLWNKLFYSHVANRPSCHRCRFKNMNRPGDLSLGDFWGIEKTHSNFFSTNGISLMLINSTHGLELFDDIKNQFEYIESNAKECMQPVLSESMPEPPEREIFWDEYKKFGFDAIVKRKYGLTKKTNIIRNLRMIKNFIKNIINRNI